MGIVFVLIGILTIGLTLAKPSFYWNGRKARRLRGLIGDGAAMIVYLLIGIGSTIVGMMMLMGLLAAS